MGTSGGAGIENRPDTIVGRWRLQKTSSSDPRVPSHEWPEGTEGRPLRFSDVDIRPDHAGALAARSRIHIPQSRDRGCDSAARPAETASAPRRNGTSAVAVHAARAERASADAVARRVATARSQRSGGCLPRRVSRRSRVCSQRDDRDERRPRIAAAWPGRRGRDHRSGVRRDRTRGWFRLPTAAVRRFEQSTSSTRYATPAMLWNRLSGRSRRTRSSSSIDHVTAQTALVLPVAAIAAECHARGVPVLVDGAHVPGSRPLDIPSLGVDWYSANLHKWAHAPRGCGILWAAPDRQSVVHSPIVSWGHDKGFREEFEHTATSRPDQLPGSARGYCPAARVGLRSLCRVHARSGLGSRRHAHGTLAHDIRDPARHGGRDGHGAAAAGRGHDRCRCDAPAPCAAPRGADRSPAPRLARPALDESVGADLQRSSRTSRDSPTRWSRRT